MARLKPHHCRRRNCILCAINEAVAQAWDDGAKAMSKARLVQGESLPPNPYRVSPSVEKSEQ